MSTTTAPADSHVEAPIDNDAEASPSPGWVSRTMHHPTTQLIGRIARRTYVFLLLLTATVQAVVLFLLWKWPSYDWGQLLDRFVTSPAMAGLFAVIAAVIGAWSLNRQLRHTKQKAEDEAWWEQFEWVTDRIVSPDEDETEKAKKAKDRLPSSLAFSLMTALSKSARAPFQKAAVAGIVDHYLRDFPQQDAPSPEQHETATPAEPSMDAAGVESLRGLLAELPQDATASYAARRVLSRYEDIEYEREVRNALRQRFGEAAVIQFGGHKLVVQGKPNISNLVRLKQTVEQLRAVMEQEGAATGVIVTRPQTWASSANPRINELFKQGIHLVEWVPAEGSGALRAKIRVILPDISRA